MNDEQNKQGTPDSHDQSADDATATTAPEAGVESGRESGVESGHAEVESKEVAESADAAVEDVSGDSDSDASADAGDGAGEDAAAPAQVFDGKAEGFIDGDEPVTREGMNWFVLRVASNKESSVQNTLLRKIQIEGMTHLVGRILVPTEKTRTIKAGKQKITETKLYPGYVFVEMALEDGRIPQDVFFLIKETTGVGDFIGTAGRPTPLAHHEIEKMLIDSRKPEDEPVVSMRFEPGDNVAIKEGPFENYEGTVDEVFPDKGMVRVLVTIFGRQAPVDLEEWQIAPADEV